jgi:hypothetical protein
MILKLLGIKPGNIGEKLFDLIFAFGSDVIEKQIREAITKRMSARRKQDVARQLEDIAAALRKGEDESAAVVLVTLLEEIKP